MSREQRRSGPSAAEHYAAVGAESAGLRRELAEARERHAAWRGILVENGLIGATPREELRSRMDFWCWPLMKLGNGRWVGGCEHAWAGLLCHGLTDDEVDELIRRDQSDGLSLG